MATAGEAAMLKGDFARAEAEFGRLAAAAGPLWSLSRNKFYLDEVYFVAFVLPLRGLAQLSRFFDWAVIDGFFEGLEALARLDWRLSQVGDAIHGIGQP